ncbi:MULTISPECIES: hypothetical protein [unclassified Bradyrhizobium]|uniref:hypothetical protein n=1 Tax=unclassified Bradyrhizobium TaxID=2631580 RepID=UPI001FF9BA8B|nr:MULTISPECIES: hypothetical protein [unclassified Bradyrhizobium]MCK1466623.1 hypothetical protein [Bradyrhizobium sp. CW10]MCK1499182.1 hypothetical protein [Bradyrhizobium sp. 188]
MSEALRYPSFYLAFPILLALSVMVVSFEFSVGMLGGVLFFTAAAVSIVLLDFVLGIRLPPLGALEAMDFWGTREGEVAAALCCVVTAFCVIDLSVFPIPLIVDPSSYATFEGGRNHVRHISNLSWILPPLALLCFRSRGVRVVLIVVGLTFPILVIDRNRLFAALFSLVLTLLLRQKKPLLFSWKLIVPLLLGGLATFSLLGAIRTGSLDGGVLPVSGFFRVAPQGVKWLLLYVSAGVYNFSSILAKGYHNAGFLVGQLVPLSGSVATLGTDIPLDAPTINVGTEFFPFLMALGWGGALASVLGLYGMLLWSIVLLHAGMSVWRLLIFLRISYVSVMSPFAPQAFTWTNFGFVAICLMIPIAAHFLPCSANERLKES